MKYTPDFKKIKQMRVSKIAVVGPGIVGMPMAAMLACAHLKIGQDDPAKVVVIQRRSISSAWKVDAINSGKSTIGGYEPFLERIVQTAVNDGILSASFDYDEVKDAEVILVCVQTDKKDLEPDYEPLFEALTSIAQALQNKPADNVPLIIIESTLAPSSMQTVVRDLFKKYNLVDGQDILLGNSPNRVMPGRLVERIKKSDKIVAGLDPITPYMIEHIYSKIITDGRLFKTNSMTAEIEKTTENAYRDVRIAYAVEIARYCDLHNISFYKLRDEVNRMLNQCDSASYSVSSIPSGGLLIPSIGVGGHCLPKDGILLWWRLLQSGIEPKNSVILKARKINNTSPYYAIQLAELNFGDISNKRIALLGLAYRFDSDDTRNSPTFALAKHLLNKNCEIRIHDPFVKPWDKNISAYGFGSYFSNDISSVINNCDYIFMCTPHTEYREIKDVVSNYDHSLKGIFDGFNLYTPSSDKNINYRYTGIGRGNKEPGKELADYVFNGFRILEKLFANELYNIIEFYNNNYVSDEYNVVDFHQVKNIAGTCATGCNIAEPGRVEYIPDYNSAFVSLIKNSVEPSVISY